MSTLIDLIVKNNGQSGGQSDGQNDGESDSIAIIYVDSDSKVWTLSYDQLWTVSDTIQHLIKQTTNAPKNSVIGIYSEVNQLIPALMMAIMKNMCIFCYISDKNNSLNCDLLLNSLNYIICRQKSKNLFQHLIYDSETDKKIWENLFEDYIIIELKSNRQKFRIQNNKESFAYLMTTSGTTGIPKHVYVPHSCIVPNIVDLKDELRVSSVDTILICSSFTFDPSLVDLFIGLSSKSQIILIDNLIRISPQKLIKVIKSFKVTLMTVTPSFMSRFTLDTIQNQLLSSDTYLRVLIFGGEKSPSVRVISDYIKFNENKTLIYNIYGVTEVSSWAAIYKFNSNDSFDNQFNCLPILGRSLLNTNIVIEDNNEFNELIIKSDVRKCLVISFDCNNFYNCSQKWSDSYCTGDCAKVSNEGLVYITGRSDSLIKLNGKKFDLQLIESKVEQKFIDNINKCVCIASEWHHILNSVINVFISCNGFNGFNEPLYCHIKQLILNYLHKEFDKSIAFNIIIVNCFPLTLHSKIDRLLLDRNQQIQQNYNRNNLHLKENITQISYDQIIKRISNHFNTFLNVSVTDLCSDISDIKFKSIGGDSIAALQVAINVENDLNCDFPSLLDRILNCNLQEICDYVFQVFTFNQKHVSEQEEKYKLIANKSLIGLKRHYTDSRGDCLSVITRRGVNEFVSCIDGNCLTKNAKQIESSNNEFNKKANILWSIDLFECIDASPLIIERIHEKLSYGFIGSHSGNLVSINLNDGTIVWQIQLSDRIESSAICDRSGNNIFIGDYSGNFYCISALSGFINWKYQTESAIKSSPICSFKTGLVFCGSHDKHLYAWNQYKSEDQLFWKCLISDGSIFSSPILSSNEDLIFSATLDGILAAIVINSGMILWKINLKSALFSSPAIHKDILVIGSTLSSLLAININNGTILWSLNTEKPVFSSPLFICHNHSEDSNSVLIGTHNNCLICVDLSSGKIKWQFKTSSPVYSTPFSSSYNTCTDSKDNNCYVIIAETNGILHLINAIHGKLIFSYKLNGQIFSSPVIHDKKFFIGCRDNHFYCISIK